MNHSIEHICSIIRGTMLAFYRNDDIQHLLTDSRKLIFPETTIFFALHGPRRDGTRFTEELYQRGVRNFVLQAGDPVPALPDANIIQVQEVLPALQALVAAHRRQFSIPVIGITGSNGKTIVKEWLNQLLDDHFNIVRSPRSYNSQIGVPLSVWQINATHELGIFEAGISQPGEMQLLEKIILPTIGVFTGIGEAHSENFADTAEKVAEKMQLFAGAATIIFPGDEPLIAHATAGLAAAAADKNGTAPVLFSWGTTGSCTVSMREIHKEADSTLMRMVYKDTAHELVIPFTDRASIENAMTCICVLLSLNIPVQQFVDKLRLLSPLAMRLELKSGINHCSIINDSYSADASSLKIALDFLEQQHLHHKRTVILSDILQSGEADDKLYTGIARSLKQKGVDRLIGIGEKISAQQAVFQESINETSFYASVAAFKQAFPQLVFRDETILIKGARIFEFEKIDALLAEHIHRTVLEINRDAMTHNLKHYQRMLRPDTKIMAMVKAFAYGSGSYEIANLLQFHKVDYLAVAYADEGVDLRKAGISLPVMVMNPEESSFEALVQHHLEPVIYSFTLFHSFDAFLKKEGLPQFPVHLELETGMNRLGFTLHELPALQDQLVTCFFKVQSVFSHLAASEEPQQDAFTKQQAAGFEKAASMLAKSLSYPFLKHLSNSAAISRHPELQYDMVRLGIGLYGIDSVPAVQDALREVSTLKSTIAQIKTLTDGDTVGYNRKGVVQGHRVIATVRIGYADGYPRSLGNGNGKMWVNGYLAPVTGSICMDMTMIDITGIPDVHEGDEVTVFGAALPVSQIARWAQTIPYEILTGISQRVKRIYFEE